MPRLIVLTIENTSGLLHLISVAACESGGNNERKNGWSAEAREFCPHEVNPHSARFHSSCFYLMF